MPLAVIPVIDLLGGQVVRGVAGQREKYKPIQSLLVELAEPARVAEAFVSKFKATEVYVADLDAIMRHVPDTEAWHAIADCGLQLLLDAGIRNQADAQAMLVTCNKLPHGFQMVIGLESLASLGELAQIIDLVGASRTIFSLDLQQGQPLHGSESFNGLSAMTIAREAIARGVKRMIVLDLASVGTGTGISTLSLCREIHQQHENIELISGGGVRSAADLHTLAEAGCSRALVASALHDGSVTPRDLGL